MPEGLRDSVEPLLKCAHSKQQLSDLYAILVTYIFRGCTQHDVRSVMAKSGVKFDFLTWRRALYSNGLLMKNGKVWAYAVFCGMKTSSLDLSMKDRNTIREALKSPRLIKFLTHLRDEYGAVPLTISQLDRAICDSVYSRDVTAFLNHTARTRMAFLTSSFGIPRSDLVDELRIGALFTVLKSFPRFEDIGHVRAICKAQAHNHSINIIKEQTSQSRQRLIKNDDGSYSNAMIPISEFGDDQFVMSSESGHEVIASSYLVTGIDGVTQSRWEQGFALKELLSSQDLPPLKRKFLSLMIGSPSAEFSGYLGKSNEEAIHTMQYSAYTRRVCAFLKVPYPAAKNFLESLKPQL